MKKQNNILKTYGMSLILIKQLLLHGIKSNRSSLELNGRKRKIIARKKCWQKNLLVNKTQLSKKLLLKKAAEEKAMRDK